MRQAIVIRLIQSHRNDLDLNLNNVFKRLLDTDRARYDKQVKKLREIRNFEIVKRELKKRGA